MMGALQLALSDFVGMPTVQWYLWCDHLVVAAARTRGAKLHFKQLGEGPGISIPASKPGPLLKTGPRAREGSTCGIKKTGNARAQYARRDRNKQEEEAGMSNVISLSGTKT